MDETKRHRGALFGTLLLALLSACGGPGESPRMDGKGPHGGRLLVSGDFTLELTLSEQGTSPEFRAWATASGRPVPPGDVRLRVTLARLGGGVDEVTFSPAGDFLRGDKVIQEPHSFEVAVEALHGAAEHRWRYESLEGRTRISAEVAQELGIETEIAGEAVIEDVLELYARILPNPERVREVRARFQGIVRSAHVGIGASVTKGDTLFTIESDESLRRYTVEAPITGVVTQRDANPGEHTGGRLLMTLTDDSSVWAELSVFPADRDRVRVGSSLAVTPSGRSESVRGVISSIDIVARPDQSVAARSVLENPDGALVPGSFATARVTFAEHRVPLAVRREGLQKFRGFDVVYAQVGEDYEVRMLELGRRSSEWVEVLGGLEPGTRYVTANSFVVKADIEKAGAAHDH